MGRAGFTEGMSLIKMAGKSPEYFEQYVKEFESEYVEASTDLVDLQSFIKERIHKIEGYIFHGTADQAAIFQYSDANELVLYGFNAWRSNPSKMFCMAIAEIENGEMFKEWWHSTHEVTYLCSLFTEYSYAKLYNLRKGEAWVEAMYFILEGCNLAKIHKYLTNKLDELKAKDPIGSLKDTIESTMQEFQTGIEQKLQKSLAHIYKDSQEQSASLNSSSEEHGDQPETVNVFCRSMPVDYIKKHFESFVTNNSRNRKPHLTAKQLDNFINRAILGRTEVPMEKFNRIGHENSRITHVFYEFFLLYSPNYESTMQCVEKYIRLLTDNFEDWKFEKVINNFSKKPKNAIITPARPF